MTHIDRYYRIQLVCANIPAIISYISLTGIILENIEPIDELTVNVSIKSSNFKQLMKTANKLGASYRIIKKEGAMWITELVRKRFVFFAGILLFFMAITFIPNRIFFFEN